MEPFGVRLMRDGIRASQEMSTADHLRAVCDAWMAFGDDAAGAWERTMDDAVKAAVEHLAPVLVDVDGPPTPRCLPS